MLTYGDNLKSVRTKLGITAMDFATFCGVQYRTYLSYERGERSIPWDIVAQIVNEYKLNSNFLLTGEGPMFLKEKTNTLQPKENEQILKNYEFFGHRLAEIQDELGYLDKAMARIMGIDEKRYMRIKLGKEDATTEQLVRLASKVDVSLDWLVKGE